MGNTKTVMHCFHWQPLVSEKAFYWVVQGSGYTTSWLGVCSLLLHHLKRITTLIMHTMLRSKPEQTVIQKYLQWFVFGCRLCAGGRCMHCSIGIREIGNAYLNTSTQLSTMPNIGYSSSNSCSMRNEICDQHYTRDLSWKTNLICARKARNSYLK